MNYYSSQSVVIEVHFTLFAPDRRKKMKALPMHVCNMRGKI